MQITTTFRDMAPSPALESAAQRWFARLVHVSPRITTCHVTIEQPHRSHHQGAAFQVGIVLSVPGTRIAISRHSHVDAHVALADAFRAARRQLLEHADTHQGRDVAPMLDAQRLAEAELS